MNVDDLSLILSCITSEIQLEQSLELRGMNLGDNLAKLYLLREKVKAAIVADQKQNG